MTDPYIELLVREAEHPRRMDIFDEMSTQIIEEKHEILEFQDILHALQYRIRRQQLRRRYTL